MTATLIAFAALFGLLFLGLPLVFALGLVGFAGFAILVDFGPAAALVGNVAWDTLTSYTLSVLPLFLLMGNLVNHAGLSRELYDASNAFVGHRKGGLAIATIMACGGFSAVCGSSLATAATMARIAIPSMRRLGYSKEIAAGSVAAGGTLGILIPPSTILVIYGGMTNTNIGQLFIAGVLPGMLAIVLYIAALTGYLFLKPSSAERVPALPWRERFRAFRKVWAVLVLFVFVIGGIYAGVFTATEAAGIGAFGAFVIAALRGSLTLRDLFQIFRETAQATAILMAVLVGAMIFSGFVNVAGIPQASVAAIRALDASPTQVILLLLVFYLILGAVFDSMAMVLLTVPVFFPLTQSMGIDPVWFGIFVVVCVEISLITPPIGMNLFIIRSIAREIEMSAIIRGIVPFVIADLVRVGLIILFPAIVLFLPATMAR